MPDALDQHLDILLNSSVNSSPDAPDKEQGHASNAMPHPSGILPASNPSAPETPASPDQSSNLWERVLESVPLGVAVIAGDSGETAWTNTAMRRLLLAGVGMSDILEWHPYEYLPGLEPTLWEAVRERALRPCDSIFL